ncbi:uncharacterized protein LOC117644627 [Thrips palmi]|uniref:Uncharacterized protein LOC117644627 n=1 Tax=Thrips palmi TaxID=161013 RepID=A0A6P8YJT3_THRPL|nr:uncharacterized protein LOC117644627 [Thrips palmi]
MESGEPPKKQRATQPPADRQPDTPLQFLECCSAPSKAATSNGSVMDAFTTDTPESSLIFYESGMLNVEIKEEEEDILDESSGDERVSEVKEQAAPHNMKPILDRAVMALIAVDLL